MPSLPGLDATGIVKQRSLSTPGTMRLARSGTEAISKKQGDEAYEMEELRAKMGLCLLPHSTGLARGHGATDGGTADPYAHHRAQYAGYLRSWVKALKTTRWRSSRRPRTL